MWINDYADVLRPHNDLDILKLRMEAVDRLGGLGYALLTEDDYPICGFIPPDGNPEAVETFWIPDWWGDKENYLVKTLFPHEVEVTKFEKALRRLRKLQQDVRILVHSRLN
mgnify:FL=1